MLFKKRLEEPRELTIEEQELATMDDQVQAQYRLVQVLRKQWEGLGRIGKNTPEGIQLEVKLATADTKYMKLKIAYDKKEKKYLANKPEELPEMTLSRGLGQIACIGLIVCIVIGLICM